MRLLFALEEATELREQLEAASVEIEWLKYHIEMLTRGLVGSQRSGNPCVLTSSGAASSTKSSTPPGRVGDHLMPQGVVQVIPQLVLLFLF
jgi:hypothetical protein